MRTITITLNDEQEAEMSKAVEKFGITLEQACAYGFFNFEMKLDPESGEPWMAIEELLQAQDPQRAFECRFKAELPSWLREDEEDSDAA